MELKVLTIFSAICLLITFNIVDAANIISGNNLRNYGQSSSTNVVEQVGPGGGRNSIISSTRVDANGNRQSTYDVRQNAVGGTKLNVGGIGIDVNAGNGRSAYGAGGSGVGINVSADGVNVNTFGPRGNNAYGAGGGGGNRIIGSNNSNNIQTSASVRG